MSDAREPTARRGHTHARRAGEKANNVTRGRVFRRLAGMLSALVIAAAMVGPVALPAAAAGPAVAGRLAAGSGLAAQPATGGLRTNAPPVHAGGGAPPGGGRPVAVVLESITPTAPGPGSTLRVTGHVTVSETTVRDVSVRLRYSPGAFVSRGVMNVYGSGGSSPRVDTRPLDSTSTQVSRKLSGGESAQFSLSVPVRALGLDDFGVYPLAVEAVSGSRPLAAQRTFLPYVPENSQVAPTRAAWLWPVIDRPHRAVDTGFIDNELAQTIAPDGRLGRLVSAAAEAPAPQGTTEFPLIWAIDPAVLQAARDMEDGYAVTKLGSKQSTEYEESAVAGDWLSRLRDAAAGQTVFSLPYGDPDLMALHRAGLDENISLAVTSSAPITEQILGRQVTPGVVWPPNGWLNQDTLDTLALADTKTVILNEQSLPPSETLNYTANVAASIETVGRSIRALIADSTLTSVLGRVDRGPGSAVLAKQRFLAETALITDERPYEEGTLLIAPPHRWDPPPGFAARILAESSRAPWLRPVGLQYLQENPSNIDRASLRYPPRARAAELSQTYLAQVKKIYGRLQRFTSILETRTSLFDYALLRTESAAWRAHPAMARELREVVHRQLEAKRHDVRIIAKPPVVLASNAATVPITIANDLSDDLAVTVGLEVRPQNRARLDVGSIPDEIRVLPEHKATVRVRMEAVSSGVVDVTLQLKTPEGKDYGKPVPLEVQATGYGTAALAVTGGAFGVLFLAVAVRLIRRTLKAGRDDDTEEPT